MRAMVVLALLLAVPAWADVFDDVPYDHWAYDAVRELTAAGILTGRPDGKFHGDQPVTRYELALALDRLRQGPLGVGPLARLRSQLERHGAEPRTGLPFELGSLLGRPGAGAPPGGAQLDVAGRFLERALDMALKAWKEQGPAAREALRGLLSQSVKGLFELWKGSNSPVRDQVQKLVEDAVERLMKLWTELDGQRRTELESVLGEVLGQAMKMMGQADEELRPMLESLGRGVAERALGALSGVDAADRLPFLERLADMVRRAAEAAGLPAPGGL